MALFQFVSPREGRELKRIVKTPLTVQNRATISDVKKALDSRVRGAPDASGLSMISAKLYTRQKSDNSIIYACGNKVNPKMFVAQLSFSKDGDLLTSSLSFLSHFEQNGTVIQGDLLHQLREDVRTVLTSFPDYKVISE